jgi:hypothetical protein
MGTTRTRPVVRRDKGCLSPRSYDRPQQRLGRGDGPDSREPFHILDAQTKAGVPPEIAYAYKKTGLLYLGRDNSLWPEEHVVEWNAAVAEYHLIEEANAKSGPKPEGWTTEIPELLVSDFSQEDFDHVRAILKAMAPVEASRPMKLAGRIELAAATLVTACEHAFESAHATGHPERAETLYDKTEELVIRRARELYAQGPSRRRHGVSPELDLFRNSRSFSGLGLCLGEYSPSGMRDGAPCWNHKVVPSHGSLFVRIPAAKQRLGGFCHVW